MVVATVAISSICATITTRTAATLAGSGRRRRLALGAPFPFGVLLEVVFLLLERLAFIFIFLPLIQIVPPLAEYLGDRSVVAIWIALVNQRPVLSREQYERVRGSLDMTVLFRVDWL